MLVYSVNLTWLLPLAGHTHTFFPPRKHGVLERVLDVEFFTKGKNVCVWAKIVIYHVVWSVVLSCLNFQHIMLSCGVSNSTRWSAIFSEWHVTWIAKGKYVLLRVLLFESLQWTVNEKKNNVTGRRRGKQKGKNIIICLCYENWEKIILSSLNNNCHRYHTSGYRNRSIVHIFSIRVPLSTISEDGLVIILSRRSVGVHALG